MPRPLLLTDSELEAAFPLLSEWERKPDRLTKTFTFADFSEAWGWMTRVALASEKLDHHPEWSNVYRTVEVELSTHDAGGITALDVELALQMDRFAKAPS